MKSIGKIAVLGLVCLSSSLAWSASRQAAPAITPGVPLFNYGGDAAEIPAQFTDNLVFLSPRISLSEPSLFELDTTAATTSIDPSRAVEIGRADAQSPVLNFEGLDFPLSRLSESRNPLFTSRTGLDYQGSIGRDFLANLVLEIDYARQTVRAFAPANYKYSGKGIVLPLAQNGVPVIALRFALERGKQTTASFLIDSSLDAPVVFSNKFISAHHMSAERGKTMPAIDPISGQPGALLGRLRELEFGKDYASDVLAIYSSEAFADANAVAGAVGSQLLRRFIVIFDYPHRQLILEPTSQFSVPDQEDKSGMLITASGPNHKTFEVVAVEPGSPAALAGIKKGDTIAGIDTDPAGDLTLLTVRNLFLQVGHKYKLVAERDGQTRDVMLQMHRYF